MKKFLMACIVLNTTLCFADNSDPPVYTNIICFDHQIQVYTLIGYSVTPEQPFIDQINLSSDAKCLNIKAGRQESTTAVQWVSGKLKESGIAWVAGNTNYTGEPTNNPPNELYFAVGFNITFQDSSLTCNNLYIAFGPIKEDVENWWLFSNNDDQENTITCYNPNKEAKKVKVSAYGSNEFQLDL